MDPPKSPGARPSTNQRAQRRVENLVDVATRLRTPMYVSDRALPPEADTVRAIQGLLHIPTVSDQPEEQFVVEHAGPDGLVTDPSFEPGVTALFPDPQQPPATALPNVVWRRVGGALYLPSGKMPKLLQGAMQNHSFLGALATVACKQDMLLDLIVSDEQAVHGLYTLQFYKHGCWQRVVVDNFLPCVEGEDRLAFACSGHVGELWPSFLEKGYAKLHGSYYALEGGSVCECLTDLTGGVSTKLKLDEPAMRELAVRGTLWGQLQGWLGGGGLVACRAKAPEAAMLAVEGEAVTGPGGILLNHIYSVIDWREVAGSRVKLLRVHCAWPAPGGVWHGAWAAGTAEWSSSEGAAQLAADVAATFSDDATFWMAYEDFVDIFNRLYVCRIFPPHWHQLTLHCGWQGPSAGGPYFAPEPSSHAPALMGTMIASMGGASLQDALHAAAPIPSSTWCCNPQFRLTVRKACEVVVALGQQDPRVEARTHVRKAARRRSIGVVVLRVPLAALGRRWQVGGSDEVVAETGVTAGRDVTVSFKAEPTHAYIIVPHTGRAGDEAAFVLRTFSAAPVEVEQLPSPLSLVLGGQWVGLLAGGPVTMPTFGSNPQYMISVPQRSQIVISVSRLDVRYAVLKPSFSPDQAVGMYLCTPEKGADGLAARKSAVRSDTEIVAEAGFASMEEAVLLTTLEPDTPYVLIPALASPGLEAPFEVRLMSGVAVELVPLPELKSVVLQGGWRSDTAGGCDLHPTWRKNPRYLLALQQGARTKVSLSRAAKAPAARPSPSRAPIVSSSVDDMVGFYILRAADATGAIKGDLRKSVLAETTFVTTGEVAAEYDLQANTPYIIIPCTYSPGRTGRFTLALSAPCDFELIELH